MQLVDTGDERRIGKRRYRDGAEFDGVSVFKKRKGGAKPPVLGQSQFGLECQVVRFETGRVEENLIPVDHRYDGRSRGLGGKSGGFDRDRGIKVGVFMGKFSWCFHMENVLIDLI